MKFVRNGWREKSFFRQVWSSESDANRDLSKPLAPMGKSYIYTVFHLFDYGIRQQQNALIRRRMPIREGF